MHSGEAPRRRRRDHRLLGLVAVVVIITSLGYLVRTLPTDKPVPLVEPEPAEATDHVGVQTLDRDQPDAAGFGFAAPEGAPIDPREDPAGHVAQARRAEIDLRFNEAVVMLHAKRFGDAVAALHRLLQLAPDMPEAYVNMGYAYLGLKDFALARDYFMGAIDLNPAQANAHYGIAMAYEGLGDLESALGGMRSFLHLTDNPDPNQIHVARARSAIWEWEARLGRGPWGPTQGIIPGLSAEEMARDGKGVATMVPRPETADENGVMQFEVKAGDYNEGMFKR